VAGRTNAFLGKGALFALQPEAGTEVPLLGVDIVWMREVGCSEVYGADRMVFVYVL
jgi:hypothetical protein